MNQYLLCYDFITPIILAVLAAASTYASYSAQTSAAKKAATQSQLNAQAQADAASEASRTAAEQQKAAARQKIAEQRRFGQSQLAAISGQGIQMAGTPLDILADTEVQNQLELSNLAWSGDVEQRNLAHQRASALAAGQSGAAMALSGAPSAGATLLSGAASAASAGYSAYGNQARTAPAKT
jgi:cytochrome c biogenesis protein CcdA